MKFLQYTSAEKQGASAASYHDKSHTLPAFTTPFYLGSYVLTRYRGYTFLYPQTLMTKWYLIQVNELSTSSDTPRIKPTHTDLHHYETWQETCEVAPAACIQIHGGAQGKGHHARLGGLPAAAVPTAACRSQREPYGGGLAPHWPQQPPRSSSCRALCPRGEGHHHTGSRSAWTLGQELLPWLTEPLLGAVHSWGAAPHKGTPVPPGSMGLPLNAAALTALYTSQPVLPPPNFILSSLLLIYMYF